jgi:Vacuolar import and degradation protein
LSPRASSPYLHQLELISSPVPDLAATLITQADTLSHNDSVSFLHLHLEGNTNLSPHEARGSEDTNQWREWDNRIAALRYLEFGMSRRIPTARDGEGTNYANRVPQRQSLYDWAPGSDDEDLYHELLSRANIPTFAQSARPQNRHLNSDSHRRSHSRSRIRSRDDDGRRPLSWAEAARRGTSPPRADTSASTAALLQSVEQHRRFNARARSTLQSYILDRDRRDNDPTPSASAWARLHRSEQQTPGPPYPPIRNISPQADLRNSYRQLFLDNSSLTRLKNSIRYLSKLRHCDSLEEGLGSATDLAMDDATAGGHRRPFELFSKLSDLVVDISTLPSVAECSWLTPGTIFTGSQHTSRDHQPVIYNRNRDRGDQSRLQSYPQDPLFSLHDRQPRRSHPRFGTYRDRLPVPDIPIQHVSSNSHAPPTPSHPPPDHWPVAITLHDISLSTLTLSGTMSATHIPDKLSPASTSPTLHGSSMRSFFEGEIIDFKTHTLETENFNTEDTASDSGGVSIDARYWRGVGPFRELLEKEKARKREEMSAKVGGPGGKFAAHAEHQRVYAADHEDDDVVEDALGGEDIIASHLRSRSWIENVLLREWILMRWKERCFIKADPHSQSQSHPAASTPPHSNHDNTDTDADASTDPASHGLSITGFYYVALRRQTGEIDGLYYDPGSLPFQILELRPKSRCLSGGVRVLGVKETWPALGFR